MADQPVPVVLGDRAVPQDAAVRRHPHPPIFFPGHDLSAALVELRELGIRTAYVEAGPTLASAFVRAGLVDELHIYLAPTLLGGPHTALTDVGVDTITDQLPLDLDRVERLGNDVLVVARTPSPATLDDTSLIETARAEASSTASIRQGA
jgi:diaminohydroxyphosphoribosylaminopyrimidine deaminase/5-amino-6-(5-phosphoribosylamino)uracil reductase